MNIKLNEKEIEMLLVGLGCLEDDLEYGDKERIDEEYEGIDVNDIEELKNKLR